MWKSKGNSEREREINRWDLPVSNVSPRGRTRGIGGLLMGVEISISDRHGFVHFFFQVRNQRLWWWLWQWRRNRGEWDTVWILVRERARGFLTVKMVVSRLIRDNPSSLFRYKKMDPKTKQFGEREREEAVKEGAEWNQMKKVSRDRCDGVGAYLCLLLCHFSLTSSKSITGRFWSTFNYIYFLS